MPVTRTLFVVHKWTGLASAVFVLFFSVTGAVAVYYSEIDRLNAPGLALPEAVSARPVLQHALEAAQRVAPERAPELMWLPSRPDEAIVVRLAPGVDQFRVFVDPATARVTGTTSGEHAANVVRQLHLRFYFFGWQGRVVTGAFGLVLLLSAITGLFIYAPFMKGVWHSGRRWWQIRDQRRQFFWSDVHKLVGVTALFFNVIIGATGAVLGLENLQRFSPSLGTALHPSPGRYEVASCDRPAALDRLVEAAEHDMSGFTASLISFPSSRQPFYTVSGTVTGRLRAAGSSWVAVDGCARALGRFVARQAAFTARTYVWMEPLHFGDWGGWPLKLLYCVLGMTSGVLAITGLGLWAIKRTSQL
ncbi:MAG: PepSY-associated TM helix domain-containing protein [Acidimicrobiia bacterium]